MSGLTYIVPHDFTAVADKATLQALRIAKRSSGKVVLLHIAKGKGAVAECEQKLNAKIQEMQEYIGNARMEAVVKTGSIFSDIAKTAKEEKAHMIVMGTHGAKGMQKVFGSFAVKVIRSTHTPFLIVQEGDTQQTFENMVFAVDTNVESLQILETAKFMAKAFGATIHMVAERHGDRGKSAKIKNRMKLVLKQFQKAEIGYEAAFLSNEGSFSEKLMKYGERVNVSLFAVTHDSTKLLSTLDKFTQEMITNRLGKPCLIINVQEVSTGYF